MPTPSSSHSPDQEELVALYALGVLEGGERQVFEVHLGQCNVCQARMLEDRMAVAALAAASPEMEPSPGFKPRLLQQAADELGRLG